MTLPEKALKFWYGEPHLKRFPKCKCPECEHRKECSIGKHVIEAVEQMK